MNIGVIGVGVVGGALVEAFREKNFKVSFYDKKVPGSSLTNVLGTDIIFICLPTPTFAKTGKQDLGSLEMLLSKLSLANYAGVVCIKSTVLPGTCTKLCTCLPNLRITHNPEFLTAAQPLLDFRSQKVTYVSGALGDTNVLERLYAAYDAQLEVCVYEDHAYTEMIKYVHNCFLATKVGFFNDMFDICAALKLNYDSMLEGALRLKSIGAGHTRVPGPDGKRGFGGMCFIKDTGALYAWAEQELNINCNVIGACIASNEIRRPEAYNGEETTGLFLREGVRV